MHGLSKLIYIQFLYVTSWPELSLESIFNRLDSGWMRLQLRRRCIVLGKMFIDASLQLSRIIVHYRNVVDFYRRTVWQSPFPAASIFTENWE